MEDMEERIVMTPKSKTPHSTVILVERRKVDPPADGGDVHVGGGQHRGIIVNKKTSEEVQDTPPQLQLEFKVFLVNASTGRHTQEVRHLRFWFRPGYTEREEARMAQDFFRELVAPLDFPRDYVGFIKKVMKMLQHTYKSISKVEIELRQLQEMDAPPERAILEADRELTEERVLEVIESVYPNPITTGDIAKRVSCPEEKRVSEFLRSLEGKGLVKPLSPGCYTRAVSNDTDVQVVRQMPSLVRRQQPTIAIITAHYCEKLAVDAMILGQETYVRYTTVGSSYGESNVYTLGHIGGHRVVCTKLPQTGHDRSASIAAGSTTTRLLGTFQHVTHVFLVGVGGGVPHYTDYTKHVRLGDVVVAAPPREGDKHIYLYCQSVTAKPDGGQQFECRSWGPPDLALQHIAAKLKDQAEQGMSGSSPWLQYLSEAELALTEQEMSFQRPPIDTDRLYMSIGGSDVIQVTHPAPQDGQTDVRVAGVPRIHLGLIASGPAVVGDTRLHQDFAAELSVLAFDQERDAVLESVYGNRKETYTVIRGIADYRDGSINRDWQPHAALAAASFMKAVICGLEAPE